MNNNSREDTDIESLSVVNDLLKRHRIRIISITAPLIVILLLFIARHYYLIFLARYDYETTNINFISFALISACVLYSLFNLIMLYLQTGFRAATSLSKIQQEDIIHSAILNNKKISNYFTEIDKLRQELKESISSLKSNFDNISEQAFEKIPEEMEKKFVNDIVSKLNAEAGSTIMENLKTDIAKELEYTKNFDTIKDFYLHAMQRLSLQIDSLDRTGKLNLAIGCLATLGGFILLNYFVFTGVPSTVDIEHIAVHYTLRISLIVFIEVFAFFFLKLYKESIYGMRYFQNEATSFQSKIIALTVTISQPDSLKDTTAVVALSNTERNFILKKSETTQEIEQAKIESLNTKKVTDILISFLKATKHHR